MKLSKVIYYSLWAIMLGFFAWAQAPTRARKESVGLQFSQPVETPDGVYFSWLNASPTQTHSIYRRLNGTHGAWERIAMGLSGAHGRTFVPGFTLAADWDYEFREDIPE